MEVLLDQGDLWVCPGKAIWVDFFITGRKIFYLHNTFIMSKTKLFDLYACRFRECIFI